jgi:hypothetical protein
VRWFGHRLYVASETGDWRTFDLSVLKSSYCDLMRQVWREVPEVWKEGQLEPGMPGSHECIEGG